MFKRFYFLCKGNCQSLRESYRYSVYRTQSFKRFGTISYGSIYFRTGCSIRQTKSNRGGQRLNRETGLSIEISQTGGRTIVFERFGRKCANVEMSINNRSVWISIGRNGVFAIRTIGSSTRLERARTFCLESILQRTEHLLKRQDHIL